MFLPTIQDGLSEEEAVETLMSFAKRPMDRDAKGFRPLV